MTIAESNKLIAEFMGHTARIVPYADGGFAQIKSGNKWVDVLCDHKWDQLMPVVERIEQTVLAGYEYTHDDKPASFRVAIFVRCCDICVANSTGDNLIEVTAAPSKIEAVYSAVVQFIQWYNQQNKTNEPTT